MYNFNIRPVINSTNTTGVSLQDIQNSPGDYYNNGDVAFMLLCGTLVFLMIPGISLIYAGASDSKSAVTIFRLPLFTCAVVGCQWFLFGYGLAFSPRATSLDWTWWGGASGLAFEDVGLQPVRSSQGGPALPRLVYAFYQEMFACFTATIVGGAVYRKFGTIQFLIFIFLWTTIVYDPIARWSWSPQGWSNHLYSSLDFAGGTVVHISSGAAATAIGTYWGFKVLRWKKSPRFTTPEEYDEARLARVETTKPQNIIYIGLGTMLLWMGWFGFNGGSELSANARAASACISTQTAACFGGLSSLIIHWIAGAIKEKKNLKSESNETTQVFCDGVVVALVAITPAAGYVPVKYSAIFGFLAAVYLEISRTILVDILQGFFIGPRASILLLAYDPLFIGLIHAGGGLLGMFLTAFFSRGDVFGLDGYSIPPDDLNDKSAMVRNQLRDACAGWAYSFVVTFILVALVDFFTWLPSKPSIDEMMRERGHQVELIQVQIYDTDQAQTDTNIVVHEGVPPTNQILPNGTRAEEISEEVNSQNAKSITEI